MVLKLLSNYLSPQRFFIKVSLIIKIKIKILNSYEFHHLQWIWF